VIGELDDDQVAVIGILREQLADGEWHFFGPLFAKSGGCLSPEMSVRVRRSQQIGRRALSTPIPMRVREGRRLTYTGSSRVWPSTEKQRQAATSPASIGKDRAPWPSCSRRSRRQRRRRRGRG
jgi:hypothetical protein